MPNRRAHACCARQERGRRDALAALAHLEPRVCVHAIPLTVLPQSCPSAAYNTATWVMCIGVRLLCPCWAALYMKQQIRMTAFNQEALDLEVASMRASQECAYVNTPTHHLRAAYFTRCIFNLQHGCGTRARGKHTVCRLKIQRVAHCLRKAAVWVPTVCVCLNEVVRACHARDVCGVLVVCGVWCVG